MSVKEDIVRFPVSLFKGLNLTTSPTEKDTNSATRCSNAIKTADERLTIRSGVRDAFHQTQSSFGHTLWPTTYSYNNTSTGAYVEELVALGLTFDASYNPVGTALYKLVESTLTITYSGAGNARVILVPVISAGATNHHKWKLTVVANSVTIINGTEYFMGGNLGDSAGASELQDLVAAIEALANFTCSIDSTANNSPIDVLGPYIDVTFATTTTIDYYSTTTIDTAALPSFVHTEADFIVPSFLNYSNVLYIAYGDYLFKYDGRDFFYAGLPQASISAVSQLGVGDVTHTIGARYIYKVVYVRVDNQGNIIEGEESDDTLAIASVISTDGMNISLFIPVLKDTGSTYFRPKSATINGDQTTVTTITVDSGHTLEVEDTAYFYDGVGVHYDTRRINAVTATTISIDGAAVTVGDNAFISNNVRIQVWRTFADGVDFYFMTEVPNRHSLSTTTVTDIYQDFDDGVYPYFLGDGFVEQTRKHSRPPKCSYLAIHQGLMVLGGDSENPTRLSWNLPDAPEAFPLEANNIDIRSGTGKVTGFGTIGNNTLAVFKENTHALIKGSFDDLSIQVLDRTNTGIGCTSFRSLGHIGDNDALIGLSLRGPFIFLEDTPSVDISSLIQVYFDRQYYTLIDGSAAPATNNLVMQQAIGFNDTVDSKFHLYVPAYTGPVGGARVLDDSASLWLVFDYAATVPYWTTYTFYDRYRTDEEDNDPSNGSRVPNAVGGFCRYANRLWFGHVHYAVIPSYAHAYVGGLAHFKDPGESYAYSDNAYPIYLDIIYAAITREPGAVGTFFRMLLVRILRFFSARLSDPGVTDTDDNFSLTVKLIADSKPVTAAKITAGTAYYTDRDATFLVESEQTALNVKAVSRKTISSQIVITNEEAEVFEIPSFDTVEAIYITPFDRRSRDPKRYG